MDQPDTRPEVDVPDRAGLSGGVLTILFVAVVAIGGLVTWLVRGGEPDVAQVGAPAPNFILSAFDGTQFELADHLDSDGRPVVLNLWASWCIPCREEFPALSDYAEANPDLQVVGAAVQDQEENAREFAAEMDPSFLVGFDHDNSIRDAYPTFGLPATFLIDRRGVVIDILDQQLTPERLAEISFD